jgi:hypothetical protein
MQNLFDSHDTGRILSAIKNKSTLNCVDFNKYHYSTKMAKNPNFNPSKPGKTEIRVLK